jgi:hypothetical protein
LTFPPWLALALAVTLALSALYQLLTQHYGWRILVYWLMVFAGFFAAELLAESVGWNITRLGDLRLLPDLAGAATIMAGMRILKI